VNEQCVRHNLTTGLRQTFVPPFDGRDSAAQPERSPLASLGENAELSRERLPSLRSGRTRRSRPMPLRGTA